MKNVITAVVLIAASAFTLLADTSKISPDLQELMSKSPASANINVIVQYNTAPSTTSNGGGGLLGGLLGTVVNLVGGTLKTVFSLIPLERPLL